MRCSTPFYLFLGLFALVFTSSLICLDTNALRHDVNTIPISNEYSTGTGGVGPFGGVSNPPFMMSWRANYQPDSGSFKLNQNHYFRSYYNGSSCIYGSPDSNTSNLYSSTPRLTDTGRFEASFPSYRFYHASLDSNAYKMAQCMQTSPFGEVGHGSSISSHPSLDEGSLNNIPLLDRFPYLSLPPYYYDYDGFYLHSKYIDSSSGIHYSNSLKLSEVVGFLPNKFAQLRVPLGYYTGSDDTLVSGTPFTFKGVFDFSGSGNYLRLSNEFISSGTFEITVTARAVGDAYSTNRVLHIPCSSNLISLGFNDTLQFEFDCPTILDFDVLGNEFNASLYISIDNADGGDKYVWDTNADFSFATSYFVTNNDETKGSDWGSPITGNHSNEAPGSAQNQASSEQPDFINSLLNTFDFSVLNPFEPLFYMFNNDTCASIPILSSMLNSSETQVCPFFSSTIRNITTPVLSLFSAMLIFGFVIHWLGSRSGNFVEDTSKGDS